MADKAQNDTKPEATDETPKCANHPQRNAVTYHHGGVVLSLCDECTPSWFQTN